jgi:hypothetical protein
MKTDPNYRANFNAEIDIFLQACLRMRKLRQQGFTKMKYVKKSGLGFGILFLASMMGYTAVTDDANDAYTLVVGDGQSSQAFYNTLSTNLNNTDAIKANFLVLEAISPGSDVNSPFSPDGRGTLFNFLSSGLPDAFQTPGYWVFLMPDAEAATPTLWTDWASSLSQQPLISTIKGPCLFDKAKPKVKYPKSLNAVTEDQAEEMMMTVCWATAMNTNLGRPVVQGLTYDGQSSVMPSTTDNLSWFKAEISYYHKQDPNVPPYLGWVHGGTNPAVDVSFFEWYDQYKGTLPLRVTEVAKEGVQGDYDSVIKAANAPACPEGETCSTPAGDVFPGLQYIVEGANGEESGLIGASIAGCAWDVTHGSLSSDGCDSYQQNIDTTQSLENQILQSYAYIFLGIPKATDFSGLGYLNLQPVSSSLPPNVVFLFSTQYFGPVESATAVPTPCVLNDLEPGAACGIENGFGVWKTQAGLQSFKNLTHQFLYYAQHCGPNKTCVYDGYAGIYMYDYIPQAWYSPQI